MRRVGCKLRASDRLRVMVVLGFAMRSRRQGEGRQERERANPTDRPPLQQTEPFVRPLSIGCGRAIE
jgi:hypothetical protein